MSVCARSVRPGDRDLGRGQGRDDITLFDSTGLAIQDLAIALAALERAGELSLATLEL
jgi:ornithine cyclodeaminase/alanine dehydrogenase-like protein (mu-crystallin family)